MNDEEILAEAERIKARADLSQKLTDMAASYCRVECRSEGYSHTLELDETAMGILRGYFLDRFDKDHPAHESRA